MDSNHFDELREQMFGQAVVDKRYQKIDNLIHQTFKQNEAGAELLAIWKELLIMSPTAQAGDDAVKIGIAEGRKSFIRDIYLTIERVENE